MSREDGRDQCNGREWHTVRCYGCGVVSEVLDETDLPRDWAARVEGGNLVRHYCARCDGDKPVIVAAGRRNAGAGRPGSR